MAGKRPSCSRRVLTVAGQVGAHFSNEAGEVGGLLGTSCCAQRELFSFVS